MPVPGPGFGELPQALVDDVLKQSLGLATQLHGSFSKLRATVEQMRANIPEIRQDRDIAPPSVGTSCGVDGSYAVERLLSTDLAAFAALAIEGLTPPSEKRFWPDPRHVARVLPVPHHESTQQLVRGTMMAHELDLAQNAPHDVVMLDYSLRTPAIYLNNATSSFPSCPADALKEELSSVVDRALDAYISAAGAEKRDKVYVGSPKYSSLRELGRRMGVGAEFDDRTIATFTLKPGEFIGPYALDAWPDLHITVGDELASKAPSLRAKVEKLKPLLQEHCWVLYYKPRAYLPAFRLEVAESVARNDSRLGTLLKAIEFQCAAPGIFEPFPLYLADRMVKHLSSALPAFLQVVTNEMATKFQGNPGEIYLAMHSYRSDGGR